MEGSDEGVLAEARALIGTALRVEQWNHQATRDAIRHYAWGVGDDNPLYSDPDYAARSRFGSIVAPPTFPYSAYEGVIAPGLPGYSWFYAGADWLFDKPVLVGEELKAQAALSAVKDVGGKRLARLYLQTGRTEYFGADGQRLACLDGHTFRVPKNPDGSGGMPFNYRPQHRYSDEELQAIERMVLGEFRRGAEVLMWGEVDEGEELPAIARGPLLPIDMTTYYSGALGTAGYKSTKMRWIYRDHAQHDPDRLPNTFPPEYFVEGLSASMGHSDPDKAAEGGMPGAYDNGLQRIAFMVSSLTNWMGDEGTLRSVSIRIKSPVIIGDTTFVKSLVTGKRIDEGAGLVDVEVRAENQLGDETASGSAVVELPL